MGNGARSVDDQLSYASTYTPFARKFNLNFPGSTAAAAASGYITTARACETLVVPSMNAALSGAYMFTFWANGYTQLSNIHPCLEVDLGTLTVVGNSFSGSASMPSRVFFGAGTDAITIASSFVVITCETTSAGHSGGATLTTTYTNQAGTGGRTATITMPAAAITNSTVFNLTPYFQGTDTGVRTVTNMSVTSGTAGVFKCKGLIPLSGTYSGAGTGHSSTPPIFSMPNRIPKLQTGDVIGFYRTGETANRDILCNVILGADD